jgi:type II secretory pathway predicted ATPase ExeA
MKELVAWFGLKRYPFDKQIKPAEALVSEPFQECAARLEYIKRRGGMMLLTGDPGVGKTLVLRCFCDSLNENLFKPIYSPLSTLNRFDMLRHLNRLLSLTPRGSKSANYSQIQHCLLDTRQNQGKTVLIILDEAHLLRPGTLEELRLLTNFKMDSFEPFILILSGQSELKRIMEFAVLEPLNQRLAIRYHMPGLSPEQTRQYISHQLKLAGAHEPILDEMAMDAVYEVSFGIPRRIGAITEQALTYAMFSDKRTVDADMVLKVKSLDA